MKEVRYYRLVFKIRAQIFEAETRSCVAETPGEIFVSLRSLVVHCSYRDKGSRFHLLVCHAGTKSGILLGRVYVFRQV